MSINCPGGSVYIVRAGDTIYTLAQRLGTTVAAIIAANPGINPNNLQIGQPICIPGIIPPPSPTPCPGFLYTIQPGDTYFRIAQRFGVTIAAIVSANPGVDPNRLVIGQQICIPSVTPAARVCAVRLRGTERAPNAGGVFWIRQEQGASLYFVTAVNLPDPAVFGQERYTAILSWGRFETELPLSPITAAPNAWFGIEPTGSTFPQEFFLRGSIDVFPGPVLGGLMQNCG